MGQQPLYIVCAGFNRLVTRTAILWRCTAFTKASILVETGSIWKAIKRQAKIHSSQLLGTIVKRPLVKDQDFVMNFRP